MRIDARSSEPTLPALNAFRAESEGDQAPFQALLQQALAPSPSPLARPAAPALLPSPPPLLSPKDLSEEAQQIQAEEHEEILTIRQESYEEDLLENQEAMEDLIENWRETAEEHRESLTEANIAEGGESAEINESSGGVEIADDVPEMALDVDSAPMETEDHANSQGDGKDETEHHARHRSSGAAEAQRAEEREMSYEEIQHLVDTVVNGGQALPYKLHHLLRKVLDSLMTGHRYPLNQHTLTDLDLAEWKTLFDLFPPHFFEGLIRPMLYAAGKDFKQIQANYELLDHILYQRGLSQIQLDQLETLWSRLTTLPTMFTSWLRQPELPTLSLEELQHPLEILHQHQGILPGATGRLQSLALQYLHHSETAVHLLEISRQTLHGLPLSKPQIDLLSEKLADYCFSQQLHNQAQIRPILNKALHGQEVSQEEIILILQGAPQKILSHLPYYCLPLSLQEIIQFIHTDPDHSEDNILALFLENEERA
ncbi:MAG: hypothetical protein AB7I41_04425 [Candidatus Sericytochromatia bacterium]